MSNLIKRTVPVFLVLALCVTCLVFPASASSITSESRYMNDIFLYQDTLPEIYRSGDSTSLQVFYTKPNMNPLTYVEAVFRSNASNLNVKVYGSYNASLSVLLETTNYTYYKLSWAGTVGRSDLYFDFYSSTADFYVIMNSCQYSISPVTAEYIDGYCEITSANYNSIIEYRHSDSTNERQWTDNTSPSYNVLSLTSYAYDWSKYDYVDFQIHVHCQSINSVLCFDGRTGSSIPFTVSYLDNSNSITNDYIVNVRLDCRDLRSSAYPYLQITGALASGELNIVRVVSISGLTFIEDTNFLVFWFRKLSSGFDNIISILADNHSVLMQKLDAIFGTGDSSVIDAAQTQEEINVSVNNQLVGAVEDWNTNIEVVQTGYDSALTKATPALGWLASLADRIFTNMGWFGNIYFLIGLISVIMLVLSKSGLARSVSRFRRND